MRARACSATSPSTCGPGSRSTTPLEVFAVHGVGGIWGAIATGIFAVSAIGDTAGAIDGNAGQLVTQLLAVVATMAYSFVVTLVILKVLDLIPGARPESVPRGRRRWTGHIRPRRREHSSATAQTRRDDIHQSNETANRRHTVGSRHPSPPVSGAPGYAGVAAEVSFHQTEVSLR